MAERASLETAEGVQEAKASARRVIEGLEGLSGAEVQRLNAEYVLLPWLRQGGSPLPVKEAHGIYFWDYDGKRYADMSSLLVCSNLGHQDPEITEALKLQADRLCFTAPAYATAAKGVLAKKLVDLAGADTYQRVFFTLGGSDSNENAIEIARFYTGRPKILSCYRSYHGSTLGSSFASGDWRRFAYEIGGSAPSFLHFMNPNMYEDGYVRGVDDERVTADYLRRLEEQLIYEGPDSFAAILMESIVGANGVILPPKGYMEGVRALCDTYGILLICDEVMAGFYRTGKAFAWQNYDIKPDIISFAKGVTCGYVPLGGDIVSKPIADFFIDHPLPCGLTYSGHTLACATGVAVLDYYERHQVGEHVKAMEGVLKPHLEGLVRRHPSVGEARCLGLFSALTLVRDKETRELMAPYHAKDSDVQKVIAELKRRGFSTFGRESNLNVCPPLTITEDELNEWLPVLDDVLTWADERFTSAAKGGDRA